ncbi:MAG: ABC transporter permease [Actinobacteria bacterium]|nr:ABC transporter permease [Actinomycetota bacterium]
MTGWLDVRLIAGREVVTRLRARSLHVSTALMLAIVLAVAVLPSVLGGNGPAHYRVAVVRGAASAGDGRGAAAGDDGGPSPEAIAEALRAVDQRAPEVRLAVTSVGSEAAARAAVRGDVDAAISGNRIIVDRRLPDALAAVVRAAAQSAEVARAVAAGDVTPRTARSLTDPAGLRVVALRGPSSAGERRNTLSRVASFLLYGQLIGYGVAVASGVVEEKSSRVVEVLLARVRARELLTGKIVGIGALGLGQLLLYVVVGLSAATAAGTIDLPPGWLLAALGVMAWFVLGYAFYACAFAVAGALVSRQEEVQNTTAPLTVLLIVSFAVSVFAVEDPSSTVAVVMSLLPFSAPLVMPLRTAAGGVPAWQVVAAVLIAVASIAGMVRLAARAYEGGALRFGSRLSLREALAGRS